MMIPDSVITIISFLVVLGILIFIHELGHFLMAKRIGIRVERFSLGFGPRLFGFTRGDTEYMVSAFPLGGYVKMTGENPDEPLEGQPYEFNSRSVWEKTKVVFCGPGMNLVLAYIFLCTPFLIGRHVSAYLYNKPVVGWIDTNSPAQIAGLHINDEVISINGEQVSDWMSLKTIVATNSKMDLDFLVNRGGERLSFKITAEEIKGTGLGNVGIDRYMPPSIGGLTVDYPAAKAGLKVGDIILSIDGKKINHWYGLATMIHDRPGKLTVLKVKRDSEIFDIEITPEAFSYTEKESKLKKFFGWIKGLFVSETPEKEDEKKGKEETEGSKYGLIGIEPLEETILKKYGIMVSLKKGGEEFYKLLTLTFKFLYRLIAGKASLKSLGGPIMIAKMAGEVAKTGIGDLIYFMGFLSLQLGILNLFPIPILDGGHLLFFSFEAIKGTPLSLKTREIAQQIGFVLLMLLMVYVFYNDIVRFFFH